MLKHFRSLLVSNTARFARRSSLRSSQLIPVFHRMDRDNNGALDVEEVEKAAKNFGMRMEFDDKTGKKIELRDKFKEMDEDGDGELTLDEFLEFGAFWFKELKRSEVRNCEERSDELGMRILFVIRLHW